MSDIDPKVIELAKRDFGENCELVKQTEWSYTFKCGEKSYGHVSRFLAEPGFRVSASDIRLRWPRMSEAERHEFASNFYNKIDWTDNDTEILNLIMQDGSDFIWRSCALAMLRHPDRNLAVEFLMERVEKTNNEHARINYMQALGLAGDTRAVPIIRPHYESYLKSMEGEVATGISQDVFGGPIPYHAFLSTAGDLFKLTHAEEYERVIRKYFEHANENVRYWAEHALDVEGPTTLKRRAEYAKKRQSNNPK
jgi:hypothetical protein